MNGNPRQIRRRRSRRPGRIFQPPFEIQAHVLSAVQTQNNRALLTFDQPMRFIDSNDAAFFIAEQTDAQYIPALDIYAQPTPYQLEIEWDDVIWTEGSNGLQIAYQSTNIFPALPASGLIFGVPTP